VRGSIDYVNATLVAGVATPALIAALPALLGPNGTSNAAAFNRIAPEAFASAQQIGVENGLSLVQATRAQALAGERSEPGAFTFGQALGTRRDIDGSSAGAAKADLNGAGVLGGLGWDSGGWGVGAFIGYLDSRQTLSALGARTDAKGVIAGIQAQYAVGNWKLGAMLAYDGGEARTRRALPGNLTAGSRYDLHGWTGDLSASYAIDLNAGWQVRPRLGLSWIGTTRGGTREMGGGAFALGIARHRDDAWFVDGGVQLLGGGAGDSRLRPYLALGGRYQIEGRATTARASLGGGTADLIGYGAERGRFLAVTQAGLSADVTGAVTLFGAYSGEWGRDDQRQSINGGVRIRF